MEIGCEAGEINIFLSNDFDPAFRARIAPCNQGVGVSYFTKTFFFIGLADKGVTPKPLVLDK